MIKIQVKRYIVILVCMLQYLSLFATNNTQFLSGRVLDDTGAPLAGAHIQSLDNKLNATVTDLEGYFQLKTTNGKAQQIQISYLGYKTETVIVKSGQEDLIIRLSPDVTALDQIVITATRTPKALKDVPVVTRLITSDDIRKTDATNVQDLLTEELPGLEFNYAMSQETSLNMNGFGGNAVLFLVDGERLAGETMDNVDYSRLSMDNVERIEVVKGASSALYGANAVAGVVNLISRESKEPWTVNVNSRYRVAGNEWRYGGHFSINLGRWNSQTNIQRISSETIKLTDAFDTQSNIQQVWGGKSLNIKERLVYSASDHLKFIARGGYFQRESNRSNYDDHYYDYNAGLKSIISMSKGKSLELSYAYDQYDKARYVSDIRTHDHDYSNRQHVVHALFNMPLGNHILIIGSDYMNDYLTTYQFVAGTSKSQYSVDAFAQFDYNPLKWLNLIASLRYDYFSASSVGSTTARLASMFKWDGFSIRATYAGGFRAPTLKEMYMNFDMAGIQMIYGNDNLKPEKSQNFNIALEHNGKVEGFMKGRYSMTLMGYCNIYTKRITTTDFTGDENRESGAVYCNEDGVIVSGIDFSAQYRLDMGIGLKLNYSYLYTSNNSVQSQFSQPRPHSATFRIDYDKQLCSAYGLNVSLSARFLSAPNSNQASNGAYSLWKLSLQQRILSGFNINLIVDNLFNYKPDIYYWNSAATTGITGSIGLSIDIDKLF